MMSRLPGLALVGWLVLWIGTVWAAEGNVKKPDIAQNPHGDSGLCSSCHTTPAGGRKALKFGGNVLKLCQSCHDGRLASREAHPTGLRPGGSMASRIPPAFPLEQGVLTCLSCHDVLPGCRTEPQPAIANRFFLRGGPTSGPWKFCFQCHAEERYRPFNPHDQLDNGKTKVDTCLWCHIDVPDVGAQTEAGGTKTLRAGSDAICRNCHTVASDHPVRAHLGAVPPPAMIWYMSAYELKSKMRLPFERLLEYARTARRMPRSIPLDKAGRITCASCHNPHEKGLLPDWNPRSVGAEPKQAVNHRVRSPEGPLCVACHQK